MRKIKVLFLCIHNSARSQIAEGLLRFYYSDRYKVLSAGATPTQVNPFAIKVMAEIGIDISTQRSKSIEEFRGQDIDIVASICKSSAKIACPFCYPPLLGSRPEIINETLPEAKRYLHYPFNDPSEVECSDEEKLAVFRQTRDEIKKWILDYFANLTIDDLNNHTM